MCNIVKACGFLWNLGILTGDNKGYNPDQFVVANEDELRDHIAATLGGRYVRDVVCKYLWDSHFK